MQFQPDSDIECTVDHAMRQCGGVRMTTDKLITNGMITTIQAIKFDSIGDFNYLMYTSRTT